MTVHELIKKSGSNRRTIYYYIQMGLLPAPSGKGRKFEYTEEHLQRLWRIQRLQAQRYKLKEIKAILDAEPELQKHSRRQPSFRPEKSLDAPSVADQHIARSIAATPRQPHGEVWRRFRLADGIELHLRWPPNIEVLARAKKRLDDIVTYLKGETS